MVSTCKECGTTTHGRYGLCPDCRAEGRGYRARRNREGDTARVILMIFPFILMYVGYFYISSRNDWGTGIFFFLIGLGMLFFAIKLMIRNSGTRESFGNSFDRWGSHRMVYRKFRR